mmetsp:Transcript_33947/g.74321  ORF Transcript_33947/g.74321 Transcript_33947/m.74321 type:complete len:256 (+) Transcript_33947:156-923(+)
MLLPCISLKFWMRMRSLSSSHTQLSSPFGLSSLVHLRGHLSSCQICRSATGSRGGTTGIQTETSSPTLEPVGISTSQVLLCSASCAALLSSSMPSGTSMVTRWCPSSKRMACSFVFSIGMLSGTAWELPSDTAWISSAPSEVFTISEADLRAPGDGPSDLPAFSAQPSCLPQIRPTIFVSDATKADEREPLPLALSAPRTLGLLRGPCGYRGPSTRFRGALGWGEPAESRRGDTTGGVAAGGASAASSASLIDAG